jgi:hypothetical protein
MILSAEWKDCITTNVLRFWFAEFGEVMYYPSTFVLSFYEHCMCIQEKRSYESDY